MAIIRSSQTPESPDELPLIVNNGDLEALRATAKRLGFKDEESVFRFALAALAQSATRSLIITRQDGTRTSLNPSAELLKPIEDNQPE